MDKREEEFLKRLQAMFKIEAEEHIESLLAGLIELEKKNDPEFSEDIVEVVFREAHSLKGAARSVERDDIETICQEMENVFHKMKDEKFSLNDKQFDILHKTIDYISSLISSSKRSDKAGNREYINQLKLIRNPGSDNIITNIQSISDDVVPELVRKTVIKPEPDDAKAESLDVDADDNSDSKIQVIESKTVESYSSKETVRIQLSKVDSIFLQAEQLLQSKISVIQQLNELKELKVSMESWKEELGKVKNHRVGELDSNSRDFLNSTSVSLVEINDKMASIINDFDITQRSMSRIIDNHIENIKGCLMMPASTILDGFPKLVRDLSRSQKKDVEVVVRGKSIEVDKRILEELKDPLIHIVRNCVDHGINKVADKGNKKGKIVIEFKTVDGTNLEIFVKDNGKGIDTNKVVQSVLKKGLITEEESQNMTEHEKLQLVFKSGISTSPIITDISGRGLGLAIVAEKVEKLRGKVTLDSEIGKGTTFKVVLPLTISTNRGILVGGSGRKFIISTSNVKYVTRVSRDKIKTVKNQSAIEIKGQIIPIVKLCDVLDLSSAKTENKVFLSGESEKKYLQILVLEDNTDVFGFMVEAILDEQQILIKKMGKQLRMVKNISGVSVLGSGEIVPVLNITQLMKTANERAKTAISIVEETEEVEKRILVTEDSITSRTLIKEILETAGYYVETAVDGMDGLLKAKAGNFDLLVSDVDMPRMNGFELTQNIRDDKKLSELPVILVTALGSEKDQEHGIEVGANAYIIKSSFERSNLLETVNRLI